VVWARRHNVWSFFDRYRHQRRDAFEPWFVEDLKLRNAYGALRPKPL
jgi:hypothetical protein